MHRGMRRFLMLALAVLAAASIGSVAQASPAGVTTSRDTTIEQEIVERLNAVRTASGLRPLTVAPALRAAAASHSKSMAELGFFQHASNDGTPFWKRLLRTYGSSGFASWSVGENLLWNSARIDAAAAVKSWMKSPAHRGNILSPTFREVGVGVIWARSAPGMFAGRDVLVATCDFGARG